MSAVEQWKAGQLQAGQLQSKEGQLKLKEGQLRLKEGQGGPGMQEGQAGQAGNVGQGDKFGQVILAKIASWNEMLWFKVDGPLGNACGRRFPKMPDTNATIMGTTNAPYDFHHPKECKVTMLETYVLNSQMNLTNLQTSSWLRHLCPPSGDVLPPKRQLRDVLPPKQEPRDVLPPKQELRDVLPPKRELRDVLPPR